MSTEIHYCAGPSCPGYTNRATDFPHPASCCVDRDARCAVGGVVMAAVVEPRIIVNGVLLTEAQAMAVRVAVTGMRLGLQDAKHLGPLYDKNLAAVELLMVQS